MQKPNKLSRRQSIQAFLTTIATFISTPLLASTTPKKIRRVSPQYIASLALGNESSGIGAEKWGLWRTDPGPIGVWLRFYQFLERAGNIAPAGWRFDIDDWWLDENGLIMKAPEFPIPPGQYYVTNGEDQAALLRIEKPDHNGSQAWSLSQGTTIAQVTHGPCRSARYTPIAGTGTCTPANADLEAFPLPIGQLPPQVEGCERQNYSVLIVFAYPLEEQI